MKDFAKSIVCNTKAEVAKVGNASGIKEFNTEADLRRWCIEHQYTYTPTHGGYYRLEDDKQGRNRPDLYAHVKAGNSKVGNGITKFGIGTKVIADGHEAIVLKETVEQGPNGIPFGWVEIKWTEGPWKGQTDTQYDYDLKKKVGNSRVGNAKKSEIIEEKKKKGVTLKVDNGQKLEFSDGTTYVKTSYSDEYREAHNYVGNADPRIASIKSKLPMLEKQNDVGGLKDVVSFVEDSIKDLRKRLDQLEKDYNAAKNDYNDWLDLRSKVQASYQLASRK